MAPVGEADEGPGAMAPYSTSEPGFGEVVNAGPPRTDRVVPWPMNPPASFRDIAALAKEQRPTGSRDRSLRLVALQGVSLRGWGSLTGGGPALFSI